MYQMAIHDMACGRFFLVVDRPEKPPDKNTGVAHGFTGSCVDGRGEGLGVHQQPSAPKCGTKVSGSG